MSDIRKPLPPSGVEVRVRYNCGTYQTQTVRGCRASSTTSPWMAAKMLATKLWTDRPHTVVELPARGLAAGVSMWQLRPADMPAPPTA